ncbi:amino acid--[acyl-carrier-protein] ligase [Undibacterium griseum]|uniref:Amino acid--[acyl-carrier-protein] ligase n=1 Tax=Undibacterium griseum TaxID=2762295 RepID=A0ABR6YP73_9BURK|nr:amino acid--[acyl-carrier-protein] ligase [Undibacterium griseum]MBC3885701.1 amino acid--[acyl-carrier-protein] ligase [Undibacterium griseum]
MSIDFSPELLTDDLVAAGHIIPVGVPGIFGRGPVFEDVLRRFDDYVSRVAAPDQATRMSFPPCLDRKVLERSEYLDSFPHLAGTIFSFNGTEAQHKELIENVHEGRPWTHLQTMTAVCLTPAACYPVYPSFTGTLPEGGRLVDMQNWVFRHEPSAEPTRMQSFRVREFVRVGTPDMVVAWRDLWLQRGLEILQSLELPAHTEVASDPFFGRGGRMLAANQREQQLKFEVVVPVISADKPTAVCSFNYHQDHFGKLFDIRTAVGEVAHTACLGFGLERIVMALFRTHGMQPTGWPQATRTQLGL